MGTHRYRDGVDASEQLLGEVATCIPGAGDRLATLLATVVPSTDLGTELRGEREALVALRMARLGRSTPSGATRARTSVVAKILTVKAAVIIGIVSIGGAVAVAAGAGVLPIAAPSHAQHTSRPAVTNDTLPGRDPAGGHGSPSADPTVPSAPPTPAGSPSPSLPELCVAYASLTDPDRGKALRSPAFQALVIAAGGPQNVPDFCASVTPSPEPTPTTPPQVSPTPTRANVIPTHTTPTHPSRPTPTPPGTPNPHASGH